MSRVIPGSGDPAPSAGLRLTCAYLPLSLSVEECFSLLGRFFRISEVAGQMSKTGWSDRGWGVSCLLALSAAACTLAACMPEQTLSSYSSGSPSGADAAIAASQRAIEVEAGTRDAQAAEQAPADAAVVAADAAVDAGLPARLQCRAECECELREGQDYMFCSTQVLRTQAVQRCAAAGGALVSIEDAALNTWLSQRLSSLAADNFWTAATDAGEEGLWRWEGGGVFYDGRAGASTSLGFSAWGADQPNDLQGEDCMRSSNARWVDVDCAESYAYACEG
jgi:hypothetical protein